jgi:hypothetical protein
VNQLPFVNENDVCFIGLSGNVFISSEMSSLHTQTAKTFSTAIHNQNGDVVFRFVRRNLRDCEISCDFASAGNAYAVTT